MYEVKILMSTYNGADYIYEQLDSIYKQDLSEKYHCSLIIRDDGSKDNTIEIIKSFKDKLDIDIIYGENEGPRQSFFDLLLNCGNADFYAFCDQDDIWMTNKLSKALNEVEVDKPSLYFSNAKVIDGSGNDKGTTFIDKCFVLSLKRVMMCNPANGNTMVWNRSLQEILLTVDTKYFTMHDEFVLTIAILFGTVYYDAKPSMYYRIHEGNVTQSNNIFKKVQMTWNTWTKLEKYSLNKRCSYLCSIYKKNDDNKRILSELANYRDGNNRFKIYKKYSCEHRGIQRSFRLRMILKIL